MAWCYREAMNQTKLPAKLADRKTNKARKREAKKREIAESAINALKIYGYARTTLRDIAAQTQMPLSSLHYYFEDKDGLLIFCVRRYKFKFIELIERAVSGIEDPSDFADAFCESLAQTVLDDAELHRLWYDIRNQAMFDETFAPVVEEIEALLINTLAPIADDLETRQRIFVRLDGAFRFALQQYLSGRDQSLSNLKKLMIDTAF